MLLHVEEPVRATLKGNVGSGAYIGLPVNELRVRSKNYAKADVR
jgi:hypothetical protein